MKKVYSYDFKEASSDNEEKQVLLRDALENRLYVNKPTFLLRHILKDLIKNPQYADNVKVSLCYNDGKAIGIALYDFSQYYSLQIFVKARHRNKGLGKKLINNVLGLLDEKEKKKIKAGDGSERCCQLWCSLVDSKVLNKSNFDEYDVLKRQRETLKVESFLKVNRATKKVA